MEIMYRIFKKHSMSCEEPTAIIIFILNEDKNEGYF